MPDNNMFLYMRDGDVLELISINCAFISSGFDGNIETQGELILQDSFQVWDPKTLIRKGRERHLFLFEMSLVFSKEVKDSNGRSKYIYKSKLFVSRRRWVHTLIFYLFMFVSEYNHRYLVCFVMVTF